MSEKKKNEMTDETLTDIQDADEPEDRDVDAEQAEKETELEKAYKDVEKFKAEAADFKDKYMRSLADFENYKKRVLKERSDLLKYQGEKVFTDLIEVVDDFDRAMEHGSTETTNPEQFKAGIEIIYKNFLNVLTKWDVRGESSLGEPFDPTKDNALSKVPVDDAAPGTVISELKKAYFYKDRLIRPGAVVVAEAKAEPSLEDAGLPKAGPEDLEEDE